MNRIMKKNIVFISWHSDKQEIGEKISKCFRDCFGNIFGKEISVFASHVDIKHGWTQELSDALYGSKYGIILLTPQALDSSWMYYEFGVLRRTPEHIWCFPFGNVNREKTPFAINQYLEFSEEELKKMLDFIIKKELSDGVIGWDECISIRQKIETEVPKLYSEINKIAVNIDNNYERNFTIREKYYDLLKNRNDAESSKIIADLTSDNNFLRDENQSLKTENDILSKENKYLKSDIQSLLREKTELVSHIDYLKTELANALKKQTQKTSSFKYCNVIDLGLPSGTLWADRNIGAKSPEDCGDYFAWGEITPKRNGKYTWGRYMYKDEFPKTLPPDHDAATANWGYEWQMPTIVQFNELIENCEKPKWKKLNGKQGMEFTSKINGKTIFFPAAGYKYEMLECADTRGRYWSNSVGDGGDAWFLRFYSDYAGLYGSRREYGFSVRAVRCKN